MCFVKILGSYKYEKAIFNMKIIVLHCNPVFNFADRIVEYSLQENKVIDKTTINLDSDETKKLFEVLNEVY